MVDLVLRPSGISEPKRAWSLQLRNHDCSGEVEYVTLCRVSAETAHTIIDAGAPYWLFNPAALGEGLPAEAEFAELAKLNRLSALMAERADLNAANEKAAAWGAAVSTRGERITAIDAEIAALKQEAGDA